MALLLLICFIKYVTIRCFHLLCCRCYYNDAWTFTHPVIVMKTNHVFTMWKHYHLFYKKYHGFNIRYSFVTMCTSEVAKPVYLSILWVAFRCTGNCKRSLQDLPSTSNNWKGIDMCTTCLWNCRSVHLIHNDQ